MNTCRSCNAPITWLPTSAGRKMPVDEDPTPDGNIAVDELGVAHVLTTNDLVMARMMGEPLYKSHFATCGQANDWRRKP